MRIIVCAVMCVLASSALAQEPAAPSFDLVSLHENRTGTGPGGDPQDSNVPLGPGNVFAPTGGQFNLRNIELLQLVAFAYRMTSAQQDAFRDMAPQWAREARFDVKARTDKQNVTKDELRQMVRSLLAERFRLAAHYEQRITSVYALQFLKLDTPGPQLRPHVGPSCSTDFSGKDAEAASDGFPKVCGGLLMLPGSTGDHFVIGARDMALQTIATSLTGWGDLGRPVVNDTGRDGNFDFRMDFIPPRVEASGRMDVQGPTFRQALAKQLGLKLESKKLPVPVLVLDHMELPGEN